MNCLVLIGLMSALWVCLNMLRCTAPVQVHVVQVLWLLLAPLRKTSTICLELCKIIFALRLRLLDGAQQRYDTAKRFEQASRSI
jgi:hypothetical protein